MPDTEKEGTAVRQSPPSSAWVALVYIRMGNRVKPGARDYPYPFQLGFTGEYLLRVPAWPAIEICAGCAKSKVTVALWASQPLAKGAWLCLRCDNACRAASVAAGR